MFNIPNYKIEEKIYNSENTIIYRGYALKYKLPVILKTFNLDYSVLEDNEKLKNEYNIARQLDVDGCLKAYEMVKCSNRLVVAMEYFNGQSLKEFIRSEEIDLIDFLNIAMQLATILDSIHKLGIIHRDIKPDNIMINKDSRKIKIIDFGVSVQLSSNSDMVNDHNKLYGTLEYMSPEQTGRMNRKIDYRTDYYSLGITLYELIVGVLPFLTNDSMEIIHNHIAKIPICPHLRNNKIPVIISDIIMKLLSKIPEERYQSSYGIIADLKKCINQLNEVGQINHFTVGKHDMSNIFEIPQKLYGREKESKDLIDTFEKAACGGKEIMLISGAPGVGKTFLINKINKHIADTKGYYIWGKLDQLNKDIPYFPFVQAFRQLIAQILVESEEKIEVWRHKLLQAFGMNGQIIIDIIPEIELIIGTQPQIQRLSAMETKNRFNILVKKFIDVFVDKNKPLMIFLDDLQWADCDTIDLITFIMKDADIKYLFIVCAYRNNKVKNNHHLLTAFNDAKKNGANINNIVLIPLNIDHIIQLVSDTFNCDDKKSRLLAEIIYKKTYGNPFFVNQFIRILYEKNLIEFNLSNMCWNWDIDKIKELKITDNVVDFLIDKIEKLPLSTQEVLRLSACIGNEFSLKILSQIYGKSQFETGIDLLKAVSMGMIETKQDIYIYLENYDNERENNLINELIILKFSHDYIQQATYSMIREELKEEIHYKIGMLLLRNSNYNQIEENIFDIVNHLKIGKKFIIEQEEKNKLAKLNLSAGKKAKFSASYEYALKYFTFGTELLSENSWQTQYKLTFDLYLERAECEYLNIKYNEAEQLFKIILDNVESDLEKAKVYKIKIILYINQDKPKEAVMIGIEALSLLGVKLSIGSNYIQILSEAIKIKKYLIGKKLKIYCI